MVQTRARTHERRGDAVVRSDSRLAGLLPRLTSIAQVGLGRAALADGGFCHTLREVRGPTGVRVRAEGRNPRYAAVAALGAGRLDEVGQRRSLRGRSAGEVAAVALQRAAELKDPGTMALVAWAAAEVNQEPAEALFRRMRRLLRAGLVLPTVDVSWMLTAATAAGHLTDTDEVVQVAADRLLASEGAHGLHPHLLPRHTQPWWRAHLGSFADQIYPVQALARAAVHTGREDYLAAANRTARRLCELQGPAGQWWWHYDVRDGSVVEGYPVYSSHQHAIAPMALLDLLEAGGDDHTAEIGAGLGWLETHPEVLDELVSERFGLIWRKVGRAEPAKLARGVSAAATSVRQGMRVPGLDRMMPPVRVDHECRPYELGWLLYAW